MTDLSDLEDLHQKVIRIPVSVTTGTTTIIPAISGRIIIVCQVALFSDGDSTLRFGDGAGGILTGLIRLVTNFPTLSLGGASTGSMVMPFSPAGWFQTAEGESMTITVNGDVNGTIGYFSLEVFDD